MLLTLKNVNYSYYPGTPLRIPALSDVSLTLESGEFVGLMGPTGCGKSTLLQIAAGILPPQSGSVHTGGTAGMVFQNPDHQLFESTLEREIAFAPRCQGLTESAVRERVDEALRAVGLDSPELRERSPFALSGGEKRRAALAGILAMDPEVLLLDEPLAGLDAEGAEILLHCLHERCRKGTAVLMAAHDPDVICENAARVIRMKEGRIVFDGTPEEAFGESGTDDPEFSDHGSVRETVIRLRKAGIRLPDGIIRFRELSTALRQLLEEGTAHV